MRKSFNLDTMLEPGQKVIIRRTVTFEYEVDLAAYFDEGPTFTPVTVEWLNADMEDMTDIKDTLDDYDAVVLSDIVEVYDIK